jgi:aryl-alcohol dehydrogenase-like predicted oxidoreductase
MPDTPLANEIILGAAALGQQYGIANSGKRVSPQETDAILTTAWSRGIVWIDTAPVYGDAELRIGDWIRQTGNQFRAISKLPPMKSVPDAEIEVTMREYVNTTCRNMRLERLDGYLLHDATDFAREPVRESLALLKNEGRLGFVGVSFYDTTEASAALAIGEIDAMQIPINLFDHRFKDSGIIYDSHRDGVRLFARSIFLQGLLFCDPETLPSFFAPIIPRLRILHALAEETSMGLAHLAIAYAMNVHENVALVLGCYRASELSESCDIVEADPPDRSILDRLAAIGHDIQESAIDPRQWPTSD